MRVPFQREPVLRLAIVDRTSATPDITADRDTKCAPITFARRRARLVFPVPGRPHSRSGGEVAAGDASAQWPAFSDEVGLPHELVEVPRSHARRKGLPFRWWLKQGLGSGSGRTAGGWACARW